MTDVSTAPLSTEPVVLADPDVAGLTATLNALLAQAPTVLSIDLRRLPASAPADITEATRWERALRGVERARTTVIAIVGDVVRTSALELALACDVRVATSGSTFAWRDDADVWPSMALYRLVHLIGLAAARQLLLLDEPWDLSRALAAGLVDRSVEVPDVVELASALTRSRDLWLVRNLLSEAVTTTYEEALGVHLAACDRLLRREDSG